MGGVLVGGAQGEESGTPQSTLGHSLFRLTPTFLTIVKHR